MIRFAAPILAIAMPLAAFVAPATLSASAPPVHFRAELAAPASEARPIAGGVVFHCEGITCIAPRSGDRPLRVCRELKREVGTIAGFSHGGEAFDAERLASCNS